MNENQDPEHSMDKSTQPAGLERVEAGEEHQATEAESEEGG
jgi:hypothetical protein